MLNANKPVKIYLIRFGLGPFYFGGTYNHFLEPDKAELTRARIYFIKATATIAIKALINVLTQSDNELRINFAPPRLVEMELKELRETNV